MVLGAGMALSCSASSVETARRAYAEGNYSQTVSLLTQTMETEGVSAPLYFDLGNAYVGQGNLGMGRLFFERARKLDPGDRQIDNNLSYLQSKIDDTNKSQANTKRGDVSPDEEGFIEGVRRSIAADHTSDYWSLYAVIAWVLLLGAIALYLFPSNIPARKVGFFSALIFLGFTVIFLVFAFMAKAEFESKDYGVVTAYRIELLTEPSGTAKPSSAPLSQGSKLKIIGEESDLQGNVAWYKVRLNSDYIGWIPASEFEII